jgi:hypothetical protein
VIFFIFLSVKIFSMPSAISISVLGEIKAAEPMDMQEAPAKINSTASCAFEIPPHPKIGIFIFYEPHKLEPKL